MFLRNFILQSLSNEDVSRWLILMLEIKKLEIEQACLQNNAQKLNSNIQDHPLLNFEIARLTTNIETIDTQIVCFRYRYLCLAFCMFAISSLNFLRQDEYVKNIQQSIAILNSTASVILKAKEKLHYELQNIAALRTENYDPWWLNNNTLNIELNMFHSLDLNVLRKIMLKGEVAQYRSVRVRVCSITIDLFLQLLMNFPHRHAICGFDRASVTAISPQCSRIKAYFPMIYTPIYTLIDCYKNTVANVIYTKMQCSTLMEDECAIKSVPSPEKYNNISLELLNLSRVVCNQVREEIESFNATLNSW